MNLELVKKVKAAILAEPKAVNMNHFVNCSGDADHKEGFCGTTGCIAGHAMLQAGLGKFLKSYRFDIHADELAAGLLGIPHTEADRLFYFDRVETGPYADLAVALQQKKPGTRDYARICAKALDRLVARADENEDLLYAHD